MNRDNYFFSKQIYKSINEDGSIRQVVSIDIQIRDIGISLPTPFNAFLLEYQSRKTSTVAMVASHIARFLNYLFIMMENPITSIEELKFQHGIDFLSMLPYKKGGKVQCSEYLTKFYYFCKQHGIKIVDLKEDKNNTYKYTKNIFNGKYIEETKKTADAIHEIDINYLSMFLDTARDVAPDIYLGLFFQFAGGLRASEIVSVEYNSIRFIRDSGVFALSLKLEDKDLRPDLSSAFISKVKRNRTQIVLPIFGKRLEQAYETHKKLYRKDNISAVFIDKNGNPMTVNTYWKRFNRVKKEFIRRLYNCPNMEAQMYAIILESYRWSTHIGRGTFSNIVAQNANNIAEIAIIRGDTGLSSSLPYLNDNRSVEKKVQKIFDNFYKEESIWEK